MKQQNAPQNSPEIILMQLGKGPLQQLKTCIDSISGHEHETITFIYTNEPEYIKQHVSNRNTTIVPWTFEKTKSATYGTKVFHKMMLEKIRIIKHHYSRSKGWFLYLDSDVVVLRKFTHELHNAFRQHKMWIQCEGMEVYPRNHCCGIIAISQSKEIEEFLNEWESAMISRIKTGPASGPGDQGVFNQIINTKTKYPNWLTTFPSGFAAPGWMFHLFAPLKLTPVRPALYHANWITNKQEKINRLTTPQFKNWKFMPFTQFGFALLSLIKRAWSMRYSNNPHNF